MTKISVVLAVHNEEENIGKCLESVKDLSWETIIVDGGSTDKTLDIAKEFGARIIETENFQNFHINKNKAIDAARGDWVLQLDADEIVTRQLKEEIQTVVEDQKYNGYWIPRRNFFLTRFLTKGGQYPDYTLRLYKKGLGRLPGKDVHEQAIVEGRVGYLKNDLLHMRDRNFSIYFSRFKRYTDLLASQLHEKGQRVNLISSINYLFIKPVCWFIKSYLRHRGYVDGFAGFVFALFSSLRFPVAYYKLWRLYARSN
ncbi:glycosyltransferase family 2 protein [Candidatus Daviesbacteria bacterium]|nr:glycosyltransferase family 2 protein [Candidatus Daviesbacteria bacterium]